MTDGIRKTNEFLIRSADTEQIHISYTYGHRIPRSAHSPFTLEEVHEFVSELTSMIDFMESMKISDTDELLTVLRDSYIYSEIAKTQIEWHYKEYAPGNFKDLSVNQSGVYLLQVFAKDELNFKVGCTQSLRDRIKQHYKYVNRNPIFLYAFIPTPNYKELEAAILYKIVGHTRLEWFDQNDQLLAFAQHLYSVRGNNE
jgi:hypothetical protein